MDDGSEVDDEASEDEEKVANKTKVYNLFYSCLKLYQFFVPSRRKKWP